MVTRAGSGPSRALKLKRSRPPEDPPNRPAAAKPPPPPPAEQPRARRPTAGDRRHALQRHNAESGATFRQAQLQASFTPPPAPAFETSGGEQPEQVQADAKIAAARDQYEAWSDPEALAEHLDENPNLAEYTDTELDVLAAISIDNPESRAAIQQSVIETVESADTLDDLPESVAFQFLLEEQVLNATGEESQGTFGAKRHLDDLVHQAIAPGFDEAVEGTSGDDELEAALEGYVEDLVDLASDWPALAPTIDRQFETVIEENAQRIQDIRRGDDPWYADVGHAVTDFVRDSADWVADRVFPDVSGGVGPVFGNGPISGFLNSELGQNLREVGVGVNIAGHELITGPAEVLTDPVGAAEAVVAVVRDPSLLLEGYRQIAREHGPNAAAGAVGFDFLTAVTSAGVAASAEPIAAAGTLRRLIDLVPEGIRRHVPDLDITERLANNHRFARLPDEIGDLALDRAIRLSRVGDEAGAQALSDLTTLHGFADLDVAEQERLLRITGAQDPYIGGPARQRLQQLLDEQGFQDLPSARQAERLRELLDEQPPGAFAPDGTYRPRTEFEVGEPEDVRHTFSNGEGDARRYEIEIDGRTIDVFVPEPADASLRSVDEVAASIASLPPEARARVTRVDVEPEPSPYDAVRQQQTGESFNTYATADVDGTVRVFPPSSGATFDQFTDVLAHETGHLVSFEELGPFRFDPDPAPGDSPFSYEGEGWDRWEAAVESDGVNASAYATTDIGEDFAETYRLYVSTRGTPWAAELRALMPERFAILDELTGGA